MPVVSLFMHAAGHASPSASEPSRVGERGDVGALPDSSPESTGGQVATPSKSSMIQCIQPQVSNIAWVTAELGAVVRGARLSNHGPHVTLLEQELEAWLGAPVAMTSCGSMALELGLRAILMDSGRSGRRQAILPACTYVATLNAVQAVGLEPVFCDIDPDTWTLSTDHLRRLLSQHADVAVVIPVNVYGVPPDLTTIATLAHAAGAKVLYDNAHGLGTLMGGHAGPAHADVSAWSMHATKVLPAAEGGFVSTQVPEYLARVKRLRNHGIDGDLETTWAGHNAKMSELHAVLGRASLGSRSHILQSRRQNLERLRRAVVAAGRGHLRNQRIPAGVVANGQNMTVLVVDAEGQPDATGASLILQELAAAGVEARRYFWPPLHKLVRVAHLSATLPVTDAVMPALVCLPLHTAMSAETLETMEQALAHVVAGLEQVAAQENANRGA